MSGHNNTEQAILDAAAEVFLEKGYNGASTTKIAEKAGVTHAMLHYYFRSKEKMFLKILDKEVDTMFSSMKGIMSPEADIRETLVKAIGLYYDFLNENRRLPFLILNVSDTNPEMLEKFKRRLVRVVNTEFVRHSERFRKGIEAGEINDIDPFQLVCTLVSLGISTFLFLPMLQNVLKFSSEQVTDFIEERKRETVRTVYMRLFSKEKEY